MLISTKRWRVHEVVTDKGTIRTDVVINAGGMYAPQIGRLVGVDVPIIPYAHEFTSNATRLFTVTTRASEPTPNPERARRQRG